MEYDPDEYYRLYILEHLRSIELSANTELVQLLKNKTRRVTKKDLRKKYGEGKTASVRITRQYPEILDKYRSSKNRVVSGNLDHTDLSYFTGSELPNIDELLHNVISIPGGTDDATSYQKNIERLLSLLFSTELSYPKLEQQIHDGRHPSPVWNGTV